MKITKTAKVTHIRESYSLHQRELVDVTMETRVLAPTEKYPTHTEEQLSLDIKMSVNLRPQIGDEYTITIELN